MKCRKLKTSRCKRKTFRGRRTPREERFTPYTKTFRTLSDGKLHCFPKQYWNQNKYFILISIKFNTRMWNFFFVASIFQNWRLSRYFDLEFAFKSFLLAPLSLAAKSPSPSSFVLNFDFETKVWDKMPTERETYYLSYLAALIGMLQTKLCRKIRDKLCQVFILDFLDPSLGEVEEFEVRKISLHECKREVQGANWFRREADLKRSSL